MSCDKSIVLAVMSLEERSPQSIEFVEVRLERGDRLYAHTDNIQRTDTPNPRPSTNPNPEVAATTKQA